MAQQERFIGLKKGNPNIAIYEIEQQPQKRNRDIDADIDEVFYSAQSSPQPRLDDVEDFASIPDGTLFVDWANGTPFDAFNFQSLLRYMERLAKLHTDPIVQFTGLVAAETGADLSRYLNADKPIVSTTATNVADLLAQSALGHGALAAFMARALVDLVEPDQDETEEEEVIPLRSVPIIKKGSSPLADDDESDVESSFFQIAQKILTQHKEGAHISRKSNGRFQLIGARPGQQDQPNAPLLESVLHLLGNATAASNMERWAWNERPENSGWSIVRTEVAMVTELAYQEIRSISARHAKFRLMHLITSPVVRTRFAVLVAGYINIVPGELVHPNYASHRANSNYMGVRLSNGYWQQSRQSKMVVAGLRFFANVGYADNPNIKILEEAISSRKNTIIELKSQVDQLYREARTDVLRAWNGFSDEFQKIASDIAFTHTQFSKEREKGQKLASTREIMNSRGDDTSVIEQQIQVIEARLRVLRERLRAIQASNPVFAGVVEQALSFDAATLANLSGYSFRGNNQYGNTPQFDREAFPQIMTAQPNIEKLEPALASLSLALQNVRKRTLLWTSNELRSVLNMEDKIMRLASSIKNFRQVSAQLAKDRETLAQIPSDQKRVLVHTKSSRKAARKRIDFFEPVSVYVADEYIDPRQPIFQGRF
jgi:hypothetical protein